MAPRAQFMLGRAAAPFTPQTSQEASTARPAVATSHLTRALQVQSGPKPVPVVLSFITFAVRFKHRRAAETSKPKEKPREVGPCIRAQEVSSFACRRMHRLI